MRTQQHSRPRMLRAASLTGFGAIKAELATAQQLGGWQWASGSVNGAVISPIKGTSLEEESLRTLTRGNYTRKAKNFREFCAGGGSDSSGRDKDEGRADLAASKANGYSGRDCDAAAAAGRDEAWQRAAPAGWTPPIGVPAPGWVQQPVCARSVGVTLEKVSFLGGWSQLSLAVQTYIDPTAVPDRGIAAK
ncbi:hypothetical protein CYMTET_26559 [Cymbomonas tetramitiformis]|uniref:Uncharacterized protein n=1 Tax=Cymbomonas tetramitiformis TaxID=36881 RepID=A0AAE0KXT8_9CHLO|nr:hypothetical protein CYMTET_26559 [Cymbomonas tetramitiformis]